MEPPRNHQWRTSEMAARRFHDALRLHYTVLSLEEIAAGRFMAIQLADGWSNNSIYDTHAQAVSSVKVDDANRYLYFRIPPPPGPPAAGCDVMLWYAQKRYDAGYRPAGVHEGTELIMPTRVEDLSPEFLKLDVVSRGQHRDRW